MANSASARKRIRQILRRAERNKQRKNRIRTFIRHYERALVSGDKKKATECFKLAMPEIHRGAQKGVLHRNTAARKLSRMAARLKAMS